LLHLGGGREHRSVPPARDRCNGEPPLTA
jgi:hypothetical protein